MATALVGVWGYGWRVMREDRRGLWPILAVGAWPATAARNAAVVSANTVAAEAAVTVAVRGTL
jgi:hypothetical protein